MTSCKVWRFESVEIIIDVVYGSQLRRSYDSRLSLVVYIVTYGVDWGGQKGHSLQRGLVEQAVERAVYQL